MVCCFLIKGLQLFQGKYIDQLQYPRVKRVEEIHVSNLLKKILIVFVCFFLDPIVRSELMEQIPHLAMYCQENKDLFPNSVSMYILPMVVRYLNDPTNQVSTASLYYSVNDEF